MKLTEDDIQLRFITHASRKVIINIGANFLGTEQFSDKITNERAEQLKQQILDDYEKARKWEDEEKRDVSVERQNQKLRELIEEFLETYHNCNPYKGKEDPLFFQDIQKLLEASKE